MGSGRKAWLCGVGRSSICALVAGLDLVRGSGRSRPVERHAPGFDQLLQVAAGELRDQCGQRAVEPFAMLRGLDHEGPQFGVGAGVQGVFEPGLRLGSGLEGRPI